MKKRIGLVAAVSLCAFFFAASKLPARAQGTTSNAQKLEKLEVLSKQLNLTPEQKAKLRFNGSLDLSIDNLIWVRCTFDRTETW